MALYQVIRAGSYDRLLLTRRRSCRRHKRASNREPLPSHSSHQFSVVFEVRAGRLGTLCYQAPRQRPRLIQFDKALAVLLSGASLSHHKYSLPKRSLWQVFQAAPSGCPWRMPASPHRNTRETVEVWQEAWKFAPAAPCSFRKGDMQRLTDKSLRAC